MLSTRLSTDGARRLVEEVVHGLGYRGSTHVAVYRLGWPLISISGSAADRYTGGGERRSLLSRLYARVLARSRVPRYERRIRASTTGEVGTRRSTRRGLRRQTNNKSAKPATAVPVATPTIAAILRVLSPCCGVLPWPRVLVVTLRRGVIMAMLDILYTEFASLAPQT